MEIRAAVCRAIGEPLTIETLEMRAPEGREMAVPDAPGLGIEVDKAFARAHPCTGKGPHLQMQKAPCDDVGEDGFAGGAPAPRP